MSDQVEINVTLSVTEFSALGVAAVDPAGWIQNAASERCRRAINEIVKLYTENALQQGIPTPASVEEIVEDALFRGWVETAKTVQERELTEAAHSSANAGDVVSELAMPLDRVQFFTILEHAFNLTREDLIATVEANVPDPLTKITVVNKIKDEQLFRRGDQWVNQLALLVGITSEQIDEAWVQALEI